MSVAVLTHPLRVRPLGSRLLDDALDLRDAIGTLRILPDDLLLRILGMASAATLSVCARVSRGVRVLAYTEDLWKTKLLEELPSAAALSWDTHGWRHSYLRHKGVTMTMTDVSAIGSSSGGYYYSDVLYAPWQCGTAAIPASWSRHQNIPRVSAASLSVEDFSRRFEAASQPVILTDVMESWPARSGWSFAQLRDRFGNRAQFHVGGHAMGLADFFDYCESTRDEQPLYLFDKRFGETSASADASTGAAPGMTASTPLPVGEANRSGAAAVGLAAEYHVPKYFEPSRDLFSTLPEGYRPDHRWLIIGTTRSGSSWHVDPNATSAWNACVVGRKKWILTPPNAPPPGVTASDDGANVTSPISLYEWFRVFYSSLAQARREAPPGGAATSHEAIVGAGEIIFVPAGWWHCALNLEPSIAITQNYAPRVSAAAILRYLRSGDMAGDFVSGVAPDKRPQMADKFAEVLQEHCPEALKEAAAPTSPTAAKAPEPAAPEPPANFCFSF